MALKKYIGLEIEAVYNSQLLNLNVGSYHEGIQKGKYWKLENDGSIKTYLNNKNWASWSKTIECVSLKLDTKEKVKEAIEEFYSIFSNNGKHELNNVLDFNSSVGFHIHLSIFKGKKEFKFRDFIDIQVFKRLRRRLFKELKTSTLKSKNEIIKHYFRGFAKKTRFDENNNFRLRCDKYQEFNFYSEDCKKGFEWRSPNFLNISTWEEFNFLINLYLKYCDFMLKKLVTNKVKENIIIEVEDIEPKQINENIALNQGVNQHV